MFVEDNWKKEGVGLGVRKRGQTVVCSNSGFLCWEALGKARDRMDQKPILYIWAFL